MSASSSYSSRKPAAPVRWICQFWDAPDVSYNAGLGVKNARQWANMTASRYGAQVLVEYTDGEVEISRPYGGPYHGASHAESSERAA